MCGALASEARGARLGEPRGDRPAPPLPRGPRRARAQSFSRAARSACSSGARAARRAPHTEPAGGTPSFPERATVRGRRASAHNASFMWPKVGRDSFCRSVAAARGLRRVRLHHCWLWLVGTCLCRPSQSRSKVQYQVVRRSTPPLWVAGRRARLRDARACVDAGWTQSLSHTWPGYGHRSVGDQPTNQPTNESAPANEAVPRA